MKTISLKLSDEVEAKLAARARRTGKTKSEVTREAFATFLEGGSNRKFHGGKGTVFEMLARKVIDCSYELRAL